MLFVVYANAGPDADEVEIGKKTKSEDISI
jgi:hypothetical protein